MTDEELLQHYVGGHSEGFTELYLRLKTGLYSYIYNRVQNTETAEDIMQDIWDRVIREADRLAGMVDDEDPSFALRPYIYRMAGNRITDYYRANWRLQELNDDEVYLVAGDNAPDQSALDRELSHCIERRMRPLRIRLHDAFWLTRDDSMSYEQAAQCLGVARETVKDWVRQVLKAIRPCREEYEHGQS